jgi:hypothetical protein
MSALSEILALRCQRFTGNSGWSGTPTAAEQRLRTLYDHYRAAYARNVHAKSVQCKRTVLV